MSNNKILVGGFGVLLVLAIFMFQNMVMTSSIRINPGSLGTSNKITLSGGTSNRTTLAFHFNDATCMGTPVAQVDTDKFRKFSVELTVPVNETTKIFVRDLSIKEVRNLVGRQRNNFCMSVGDYTHYTPDLTSDDLTQPGLQSAIASNVRSKYVVRATLQTCRGKASQYLAPGATSQLTCDVSSPLGGDRMLVVPEMFSPGYGCLVTMDKPRTVLSGSNFAVSAKFTNRCGSSFPMSDAGLGWMIYELGESQQAVRFTGVSQGIYQTCVGGASDVLYPFATKELTCKISSSLPGDQLFVMPEMYIPGNGCIVTVNKPRVVMVGSDFGVSAKFTNRCSSPTAMSEGGLGWIVFGLDTKSTDREISIQNIKSVAAQVCSGPNTLVSANTTKLTCNFSSPLVGPNMFVSSEMYMPGNGCISTSNAPRNVGAGNDLGVSALFTNRCGSSVSLSEGGLGWVMWETSTSQ